MEPAYRTQNTVTSAISDLGLFVISCRFLAIPVLLGLPSRYCACATRAVPLLSIDTGIILLPLQRGDEQTSYVTRNNHTCQLLPLTRSQASPDCDRQTWKSIGPAGRAVHARLVRFYTCIIVMLSHPLCFSPLSLQYPAVWSWPSPEAQWLWLHYNGGRKY